MKYLALVFCLFLATPPQTFAQNNVAIFENIQSSFGSYASKLRGNVMRLSQGHLPMGIGTVCGLGLLLLNPNWRGVATGGTLLGLNGFGFALARIRMWKFSNAATVFERDSRLARSLANFYRSSNPGIWKSETTSISSELQNENHLDFEKMPAAERKSKFETFLKQDQEKIETLAQMTLKSFYNDRDRKNRLKQKISFGSELLKLFFEGNK